MLCYLQIYRTYCIVSWKSEGPSEKGTLTIEWCSIEKVRWELSLYKVYGDRIAPFWFSTEHLWRVLTPFWFSADDMNYLLVLECLNLKGKFPQTTMWIGWVESNFTNPTVKVWADLDNPFIKEWTCKVVHVALSGWKLCQNMWYHKRDNSPLTLYIYRFSQFFFSSWIYQ